MESSQENQDQTKAELMQLMHGLDQLHWDGSLSGRLKIRFEALRDGHHGSFYPNSFRIVINKNLRGNAVELRKTLLHEMIHAHLHAVGDASAQSKNEWHGAAFLAEVKRLEAAGEDMSGEAKYAVCSDISEEALNRAAIAYLARANRSEKPEGYFEGKRWYPASTELRSCCSAIREPSINFPYSLYKHCCTVSHISRLFGVDTVALRKEVDRMKQSQE